jgi:2-haloacid dehalogenase
MLKGGKFPPWLPAARYRPGMTSPEARLAGIAVCAFDAYGTLFDVNSAAASLAPRIGPQWVEFSATWRQKQLQYTWLRSLAGQYADFWQVTSDALDFALAAHRLAPEALRAELMDLYRAPAPYPDVATALQTLDRRGMRLAILSNGTPAMLESAVAGAGLTGLFSALLSVDSCQVFKPHPSVYAQVTRRFAVAPAQVCFVSSNGWDAYAAKAFGFRALWCQRAPQTAERLPATPDAVITSLTQVAELVASGKR